MNRKQMIFGLFALIAAFGGGYFARGIGSQRIVSRRLPAYVPPPVMDVKLIEFLNSQKLLDPQATIASAQVQPKIEGGMSKLSGRFAGTLHSDLEKQDTKIVFTIENKPSPKGVVSAVNGRLGDKAGSRPFQFFTEIKQIKGGAGKQDSTIIQVGPDAYFQLFYEAKGDRWVTNYYAKAASGKVEHLGVGQLSRQ